MSKKKISKKTLIFWPTRTIATSVFAALIGYVTFFATDFLGISAVTAGVIFMVSKIFDGVTDIIAGYIIDHSHFKLGKGRPYELALIGYGAATIALFSAPKMGMTPSCIYLFVMYSLINSVFLTLLNCNEPVYLSNVIEESSQSVTIAAITGFISLIFTMLASMILPQFVATVGTTRQGWMLISVVMSIPLTLFGLLRFFFVKERRQSAETVSQNFTIKDMLSAIMQNKYILLFSLIILISNVGSNLVNSVQTYYFQYIMGDLSLASIMSLSMLAIIIVIILTPMLSNKFGFLKVMRATTLLGMIGYIIRIFAPTNMGLLFGSNILAMMGFYTMFSFAGTFVIDCIDYGEWKTGQRNEGTIACAQSVTAKIGTAVGVGLIGLLMGLSGYDGALTVQPDSANIMIIMLFSVVPAVFCLIQLILLHLYDLDKIQPQIHADLEKRRNAEQN